MCFIKNNHLKDDVVSNKKIYTIFFLIKKKNID